jgi:hypothetical protein
MSGPGRRIFLNVARICYFDPVRHRRDHDRPRQKVDTSDDVRRASPLIVAHYLAIDAAVHKR